jgi:serpin B
MARSGLSRDPASGIPSAAVAAAVSSNNAFAVDLYAHLRAGGSAGNLWTSPLSASLALTMTYAGAAGQTATEMATALHIAPGVPSIFDGQNALTQALAGRASAALASDQQDAKASGQAPSSADDYQLQVVNSIWGQQSYPWEPSFLDVMAKSYGTGLYLEDFVHQPDPSRQTINAWVSFETADKIDNLIPAGAIDTTTRMVLVNAIHLKLPWANPFLASATGPGTFTRGDGTAVSASFMHESQTLPYLDDGQAQIVALPLAGRQLSVVVALPHAGVDLATYEAALAAGSSGALAPPSSSAVVTLSMPKVTFTSPTFSLVPALQAMGMTQLFDAAVADLSGLCAHPPNGEHLYVADVLQKAMIAVEETGVEAAAATAVLVGETAAGVASVTMVIDRPFAVAIVDVSTGAILFLGHIEDPTDSGTP